MCLDLCANLSATGYYAAELQEPCPIDAVSLAEGLAEVWASSCPADRPFAELLRALGLRPR